MDTDLWTYVLVVHKLWKMILVPKLFDLSLIALDYPPGVKFAYGLNLTLETYAVSVKSGIGYFLGTFSREFRMRWTMVDVLRSRDDEQNTTLSWSLDGRYPNCLFYIALVYTFDYILHE